MVVKYEAAGSAERMTERPGGVRALVRGGGTGIRWASFIARPFALVLVLIYLLPMAFGLGAGYGLSVHPAILGGVGFYGACLLWGLILGLIFATFGLLRRSGRDPNAPPPWWNRSVRLRLRRRVAQAVQPIEEWDRQPRSVVWFRREARLARWLVGLAVPLLLIAVAVGFFTSQVVTSRLDAARAEATRDDPNWQIDDLMAAREVIPDEENSALVVGEVVDLVGGQWPPTPKREPGGPAPTPTPLQQALEHYPPVESAARLDDTAVTALRDALGDDWQAVELARTVARYPRGFHDLTITPNPLETLLPATQASRNAARLLQSDAALLAHDGQIDLALTSVRAIFNVSRSIGDEPFLISGLVRIAISSVGRSALRRTLTQGEASPEALALIQTLLLEDRAEPMLLREMRGERATFDALIRRIHDGELSIASLSGGGQNEGPGQASQMASWGLLWFDYQRAVGLEWLNEAVRIAHQPPSARPALLRAWNAEIERTKNGGNLRMLAATIPLLMMPALDAAMSAYSRNDAETGAAILLVAAERHRLQHGDWPATTAAIDPAILPNPPLDPFTDQPYRLERRDGQILIYSVGPNLRDEHGAYDPKTAQKGGPDDFGTGAWDVSLRRQPPPPPPPEPAEPEGLTP